MIDGFKENYLVYAPYLKSLTERMQWGNLDVGIGHWGGVEKIFRGKSDILALLYKDREGSLRWLKFISWMSIFGKFGRFVVDILVNADRLIKREELFRTGEIPLDIIDKFDFSIKKPLYQKKGIKINFYYFGEIDRLAHEHGTDNKKVIDEIKRVDKKISKMKWDLIFSDHGMLNIKDIVSVPINKNCFIDSDMARYWGDKKELEKIKKNLPIKKGKIINWKDKRFGDLIFLANQGVLISPNFWQGKRIVKAMHGYDGKNRELKGIYILKKDGKRKNLSVIQLNEVLKKQYGRQ